MRASHRIFVSVSGPYPDSVEPAEAPQIRHHVEQTSVRLVVSLRSVFWGHLSFVFSDRFLSLRPLLSNCQVHCARRVACL